MKKNKIILFVFCAFCIITTLCCNKSTIAPPPKSVYVPNFVHLVPENSARLVAQAFNPDDFLKHPKPSTDSRVQSNSNSKAAKHNTIKSEITIYDHAGIAVLYVYNLDDGYVFVSADFQMEPILAFIEHGEFKKGNAPGGAAKWLNKTVNNFEIVRQGLYNNTNFAKATWKNYLKKYLDIDLSNPNSAGIFFAQQQIGPTDPCQADPNYTSISNFVSVGPWLPVTWGQGCTYDDKLPAAGCTVCGGSPLTGCVPTAMAQVIRYWQYPTGTYNYSSMPTTFGNGDVQSLMVDAGASVGTTYGCSLSPTPGPLYFGGVIIYGTATSEIIENAFKSSSFNYSTADHIAYYSTANSSTITNDLNNGKPVILGGFSDYNSFWNYPEGEGHTWVCDGYSSNDYSYCQNGSTVTATYLFFHMNWGWHEVYSYTFYDGWFAYDNWYISGRGLNFQYFDELTYNIHP